MCLPFYKRVELAEKERFPPDHDLWLSREKPFRMYKENSVITVKLTDLKEGWKFDRTDDPQVNCKFSLKKVIY